jgi:hypothetical protein
VNHVIIQAFTNREMKSAEQEMKSSPTKSGTMSLSLGCTCIIITPTPYEVHEQEAL